METFELAIEIQRNAAQEPAAGDCAARAISRRFSTDPIPRRPQSVINLLAFFRSEQRISN